MISAGTCVGRGERGRFSLVCSLCLGRGLPMGELRQWDCYPLREWLNNAVAFGAQCSHPAQIQPLFEPGGVSTQPLIGHGTQCGHPAPKGRTIELALEEPAASRSTNGSTAACSCAAVGPADTSVCKGASAVRRLKFKAHRGVEEAAETPFNTG